MLYVEPCYRMVAKRMKSEAIQSLNMMHQPTAKKKRETQNLIYLLDIYFKSLFYYERYMHHYSRNAELLTIKQHNMKMTKIIIVHV